MTLQEQYNQALRNEKRFAAIMNSDLGIQERFAAKKQYSKWSHKADELYALLND